MTFEWVGTRQQIRNFKVVSNGIAHRPLAQTLQEYILTANPSEELKPTMEDFFIKGERSLKKQFGSLSFIQPDNVIKIKSAVATSNPFVIYQTGREVCRLKLIKDMFVVCRFEPPGQPKFLFEKGDFISGKVLKTASGKELFDRAAEFFVNPRYVLPVTGVQSFKASFTPQKYIFKNVWRARFSEIEDWPQSKLLATEQDAEIFIVFSVDQNGIQPIAENGEVYGLSVMRLKDEYFVYKEYDREKLYSKLSF